MNAIARNAAHADTTPNTARNAACNIPALNDTKMLSHVDEPTTQLEKIESASERSR